MSLQNKEVLIIDDDPDVRVILKKILESAGMTVSQAESVAEAFDMAAHRAPHIVLTDLSMPGEDGFAFLERAPESSQFRGIPLIVLSASTDENSIYRAMALGAEDYATKPVVATTLLQKIRKALRDQQFLTHEFDVKKRPTVIAHVKGTITMVGETGFVFETPVRVAPKSRLTVRSHVLTELGMSECLALTNATPPILVEDGHFLTHATAVGITEETMQKVRKAVTRWK